MEPQGSLLCLKQLATGHNPESGESYKSGVEGQFGLAGWDVLALP
jgi:hypothetical protein